MACFDFFLDQEYCSIIGDVYWGFHRCEPNQETLAWFTEQKIRLITGYSTGEGALCTALYITEDQALLISLTYGITANSGRMCYMDEMNMSI